VGAEDLVFLDTETTGLSGGTGTYAFMVGLGRFHPEGFRVAQLFMRDPGEEPSLLSGLEALLNPGGALVTFNGKAFDLPLLNTRFVAGPGTAGPGTSPLVGRTHVDLLPLARRLWRDRLESRALGYLETHVLGAVRAADDVEGWRIPELYFDYLRTGDARPLRDVFYHNAMDLLALAGLFGLLARALHDPAGGDLDHGSDLVALARLFQDLGNGDSAEALFRAGLERNLPSGIRRDAVYRLSALRRRRGDLTAALEGWRDAARDGHLPAHVELAKHCEHTLRNYREAEGWTRTALRLLETGDLDPRRRARWRGELEHRLGRLLRKRERAKADASRGASRGDAGSDPVDAAPVGNSTGPADPAAAP
jgi:hypothetical protein